MDEIMLLRKMVEEHDYQGALALIDEMDEMAKDDKINKVEAYLIVLLIHLIKQKAENRTTKSWNRSIDNALDGIVRSNKRRKAGGNYLETNELAEAIDESFLRALKDAASEAFEGTYSPYQISTMIEPEQIKADALDLIINYKPSYS
ncbi:DUF29 family protein [Larkinella sp. GY13]|uniref:DUF29 family protein n=1 Tax=Larkinella sp. GY13 TaxID=3453720 RepID=UPI003EE9A583